LTKIGWATFWAIFSQTIQVTLPKGFLNSFQPSNQMVIVYITDKWTFRESEMVVRFHGFLMQRTVTRFLVKKIAQNVTQEVDCKI
jgi:hypothetical protein